jgi:hypothetical protein
MLEGAIAYFRRPAGASSSTSWSYVDHIATVFGTGPGQKRAIAAPGDRLALIKLYHPPATAGG